MSRWIVAVMIALTVPISAASGLVQSYEFQATRSGRPVYRISYTITRENLGKKSPTTVETRVSGDEKTEHSQVVLDENNQVKSVRQETKGQRENFRWEVTLGPDVSTALFADFRMESTQTYRFVYPLNGYPIQALMAVLQQPDYREAAGLDIKILVPPQRFYPVSSHLVGEEVISVGNTPVSCQKIEVGLAGFLGGLSKKYTFWISKKTGVTVRYLDGDTLVEMVAPGL